MPSARILIIEDERQTVDALRDLFEQYGYETEVALNKHVALSILQERNMDIIILSIKVQEIPGTEILNDIRKIYPGLPVIMISNKKSKRIESSCIKAGVNKYILKPIDNKIILQTIDHVIEARLAAMVPKKSRTPSRSKK